MKKAFIQLHIAVFLAGFTGILGRLINLNESLLVWYRLLIASAVLWVLAKLNKKSASASRSQKTAAAAIGVVLIIHWVSFYAGVKYGSVSTTLVCFSAVGFFTALIEPVLLRRRPDGVEILLGLLTIAGISIIFHFDPRYKTGILISLFSAFVGSVFPVLNWKLLQKMDTGLATRYQLGGGLLFLTLVLPVYLHFSPDTPLLPSWSDWIGLIFLALVCTVLAYSLMMRAQQKIPAFTLNLIYNLEPVYGIALAFLVYREDKLVRPGFYYGLLLIMSAVVLQMIRVRRASEKQAQAAQVEI